MIKRPQSFGEEIANSVSHGLAFVAAVVSVPFLMVSAHNLHSASFVGAIVFSVTMVLLYLASTVYHAMPEGLAKHVFCKLDHGAIYLFIAGTYTPFALGALNSTWGWSLFGVVWLLAAIGATLTALGRLSHPWLSTGLYLAMGWLVVGAAVPLLERVPPQGLMWLVAGGIAYTVGVIFYVLDSRICYSHAVWHGFVAMGTVCHFVAVQSYAA